MLDPSFWQGIPFTENDEAERGLAEVMKGDLGAAESYFDRALKRDAKDVHALLGLGILYQGSGRLTKAREMYEAVLALRPDTGMQLAIGGHGPRPLVEIAKANLTQLGVPGSVPDLSPTSMTVPSPRPDGPSPMTVTAFGPTPSSGSASMAAAEAQKLMLSPADLNIALRFKTLAALRDQALITPDEFQMRRQANAGALLPLTAPPPSAGLDRPVPPTDQVVGRLRAIGRALEMRALTVAQHSAERAIILDALLPSAPVTVANPGVPPRGMIDAADAVRRVEQLSAAGLISSEEQAKERAAIDKAIQPEAPARPQAAAAASDAMTPGRPAIHLASYKSQQAADRGWAQIRRAHTALLGNLKHEVSQVNLGAGKGIFFRLRAGPLETDAAAAELCQKLKSRRQFCETAKLGAG